MDKRVISAILGAMAIIVVGLGFLIWLQMRGESVPTYDSDTFTDYDGPAVDSGARIEIEKLRQQIEGLNEQIKKLEGRISGLESRPGTARLPGQGRRYPSGYAKPDHRRLRTGGVDR